MNKYFILLIKRLCYCHFRIIYLLKMKSKWTKWKRVKKKRIDYYGNIFQVEREYGESLSIKGSDSVDNRDLLNIAFNIARIPCASARQSNEYTGDKTFLWTNIKPWVAVGSHQSFSGWARSIGREAAERERERERAWKRWNLRSCKVRLYKARNTCCPAGLVKLVECLVRETTPPK